MEPAAIAGSLAMHPMDTLGSVGAAGSSLIHGDFSGAVSEVKGLVDTGYKPQGILGGVFRAGQAAQALTGGLVGTLEVRQGLKTHDGFQVAMGGADLLGAAAAASVAVGNPTVGMGISFACAAAKVGMVAFRPERYTRIQKVDTMFSAAGAVSSAMLKAGVAVVPALIANALLGPTQLLYMNCKGFQARADRAIDWVSDHLPHRRHSDQTPPA